jgi:hypothetical protein
MHSASRRAKLCFGEIVLDRQERYAVGLSHQRVQLSSGVKNVFQALS